MPAVVLTSIAAAKKAGILKDLRNVGEKLLGALSGCKIKPKGSPHPEVHKKLPKFWYVYCVGVPGAGDFNVDSPYGRAEFFDIASGQRMTSADIEGFLPVSERKALEATARKPCESVTGDMYFYCEGRNKAEFQGFVRLNDGKLYDAKSYGVKGGHQSTPEQVNIPPRGLVEEKEIPPVSGEGGISRAGGLGLGVGLLTLLLMAPKGGD